MSYPQGTLFNELLRATTAEELNVPRVEAYLDSWLESKRILAKAKGTLTRYEPVLNGFVASLPERRRTATLASLTASEIERFRNSEKYEWQICVNGQFRRQGTASGT